MSDKTPKSMLIILLITLMFGAFTLGLSITEAESSRTARKTDIETNENLIRKVQELQRLSAQSAQDHELQNQEIHQDICRLIYEIAQASPTLRGANLRPCGVSK